MDTNSIYVTSTIPFVNARPHIGFALELVQADAIARYNRLRGRPVRFQTGTDEHAFKNVLSARERGIPTAQLVDENAAHFRTLCDALTISQDRFLRTTEPAHKAAVQALWKRLRPDDLYRRSYSGLYCVGCEDFYLEKDLVGGVCPDHGTRPTVVAEENYFFRLSAYQERLERLLRSGGLRVVPEVRRNEVLQFVRSGLCDISVSRVARRSGGWGVPVPQDADQVIYVWIDALINYLSGLGFGAGKGWNTFWNGDGIKLHVIGKNVWKFHAVYWPALLLSAGIPVPDTIFVHGFLTHEGRKISKSLGNGIDPVTHVARYGADSVRYYLLRYVRPFEDGDFSEDRLRAAHDADLANGLGNLYSRVTALCERAEYGAFQPPADPAPPDGFHAALERFAFDEALGLLWGRIRAVNRDIEAAAPWSPIKERRGDEVRPLLASWLGELYGVAHWLEPFVPAASAKITAALASGTRVRRVAALFPRIGGSPGAA